MNAINVNQLSHRYGAVQTLHKVSLSVEKGELFGLIGPDAQAKPPCSAFSAPCCSPAKEKPRWMASMWCDK